MKSSRVWGSVRGYAQNTPGRGLPFEAPLKDWLNFVVFALAWAVIGRALLFLPIHPIAIAIVWLIGFVWGAGYFAAGKGAADRVVVVWLGFLGVIAALATVIDSIS